MMIYAFRTMAVLLVPTQSLDEANAAAERVSDLASVRRVEQGITSVLLEAAPPGATADPLDTGFSCPLGGYVSVEADSATRARARVEAWKALIIKAVNRAGMAFGRFDLHIL